MNIECQASFNAVFRVGAAVEVLGVKCLAFGVGNEIVEQQLKFFRREAAVLFPPDRFFGLDVGNNKLVFGAAAGMGAGLGTERAALHQLALAGGNRVFDQNRVG
jgi:hypothetical protein